MTKIYTLSITENKQRTNGEEIKSFEAITSIGIKEYNKAINDVFEKAIMTASYLEHQMSLFLMEEENKGMLSLFVNYEAYHSVEVEQTLMNLGRNKIIELLKEHYSIKKLINENFLEEMTDMELKTTERTVVSVVF